MVPIGINRPRGWGSIAAALILTVLTMAPAIADGRDPVSDEARIVEYINQTRADDGLGPLTIRADLVDIARAHAGRMAAEDRLYHNPNLRYEVTGYLSLAENIAYSTSAEGAHREMLSSPPHRGVILNPAFTEVGVGVVWVDRIIWVSHVFREPDGSRRPRRRAVTPVDEPVGSPPSRPAARASRRASPAGRGAAPALAAVTAPPAVATASPAPAAVPPVIEVAPVTHAAVPVAAVAATGHDLGAAAPAGAGDEAVMVAVVMAAIAALTVMFRRLLGWLPFT